MCSFQSGSCSDNFGSGTGSGVGSGSGSGQAAPCPTSHKWTQFGINMLVDENISTLMDSPAAGQDVTPKQMQELESFGVADAVSMNYVDCAMARAPPNSMCHKTLEEYRQLPICSNATRAYWAARVESSRVESRNAAAGDSCYVVNDPMLGIGENIDTTVECQSTSCAACSSQALMAECCQQCLDVACVIWSDGIRRVCEACDVNVTEEVESSVNDDDSSDALLVTYVLGGAGLVCLLGVCFALGWLIVRCPRPKAGTRKLLSSDVQGLPAEAHFRIVNDDPNGGEAEGFLPESPSSKKAVALRVIWDLEQSVVDCFLTGGAGVGVCEEQVAIAGEEQADELAVAAVGVMEPAFADGQQVEYFSTTHTRWLPATLSVKCGGGKASVASQVVYNVTLGARGQLRYNIGLEMLRLPLNEGEPCEFYSSEDDEWLDAVVYRQTRASVSIFGYRIKLQQSREVLPAVPPSRLRRRFPCGSLVEVYSGPSVGWQQAVVVSQAAHSTLEPQDVTSAPPVAPPLPIVAGDEKCLWTSVVISREQAGSEPDGSDSCQETVSSNLLRFRTLHLSELFRAMEEMEANDGDYPIPERIDVAVDVPALSDQSKSEERASRERQGRDGLYRVYDLDADSSAPAPESRDASRSAPTPLPETQQFAL